jgi:5'-nucleotidase
LIPSRCRHGSGIVPGIRLRAAALLFVVAAFAFVAANGASQAPARSADSPLHLRVLATDDLHGGIRPAVYPWSNGKPVGGLAALTTVMKQLESACACPTVRLDAGDQMQGTLESNLLSGAPIVAAFNLLGLDAAAVGNHELDWGLDTFLARQKEARYPWLAANVFRVDTGTRPDWARPFAIVERSDVRVGIVGYATVLTPQTLRPDVTQPYEFRSGYAGIRDAVEAVWRERPDFVIVVAHAGGGCAVGGCAGEMVQLAAELPAGMVHLIVGGHDHNPGEGTVNAIPIVRPGSSGRAVALVDLYRLGDGAHAFRMSREAVYADDVPEDAAMAGLLAPYIAAADAKGREPVTTLAEPLSRSPNGDRRLGSLITDVTRRVAGADVAVHNPSIVRTDLPRGVVSYADLFRVMPFGDEVVRLTLSGRQLRQLVEQAGPRYYYANIRVEWDTDAASGARHATLVLSDGSPIRDGGSYRVATSDFLADGGDGLATLAPLPRTALGVTVLDAVVQQLRALPSPVTLPVETRQFELQPR